MKFFLKGHKHIGSYLDFPIYQQKQTFWIDFRYFWYPLRKNFIRYTDTIKYPTVCPIYLIKWLFKSLEKHLKIVKFIDFSSKPWITGSGFRSRSKNFKTPFFSRYQKFPSWGNSNGSKTTPKFFSKFFFNKYGR